MGVCSRAWAHTGTHRTRGASSGVSQSPLVLQGNVTRGWSKGPPRGYHLTWTQKSLPARQAGSPMKPPGLCSRHPLPFAGAPEKELTTKETCSFGCFSAADPPGIRVSREGRAPAHVGASPSHMRPGVPGWGAPLSPSRGKAGLPKATDESPLPAVRDCASVPSPPPASYLLRAEGGP